MLVKRLKWSRFFFDHGIHCISVSMQSDFISKCFRSTATNEENTIYPSYFQLLLLAKKVRNTKS